MRYPAEVDRASFTSLESEVRRRIQKAILDRRIQGPVSTTSLCDSKDYDGIRFKKSYENLLTLIFLCQFSTIFDGFEEYILYEVRNYLEKNLLFPDLTAMSTVKQLGLLVFLLPCQRNTLRYLFGTVLDQQRIEFVIRSVSLIWIDHRKPKQVRRHRGYRDHGTLRPSCKWIERHDLSFVEAQMALEDKRERYHSIVSVLVRAAGEWYLRTKD